MNHNIINTTTEGIYVMGGFEWGLWIFLVIWGTGFCGMDGDCKKIFTDQEISVLVQLYSQVMQLKHFAAEKQTKKHPKKKKLH